jgi:hypothetical protein
MFLTAPETKGKTLEEMDSVFDNGIPAWKTSGQGSRLDQLQRDIEKGEVKVATTAHPTAAHTEHVEPKTT